MSDLSMTKSEHRLPSHAGTLLMWWFLGGLFMLFGASMVGYIIIRLQRRDTVPFGTISDLPWGLFVSTLVVLGASFTIHQALSAVRREKQTDLRKWTILTLLLGVLFVAIQTPCMWMLLADHWNEVFAAEQNAVMPNAIYGLIFALILIHAAHVLGGLIHLIVITRGVLLHKYDHEFHAPIRHAAMYWHFLDVVWLIMFGTILIFR